ncbi:hypothetical protein NDI56_21310 [Haloarcula sp. S1CR25-12]|uniref:TFIIS-type domain-containing protein n=1 Tax=Haloarcula saliterrae TaxID=2950534 RepID=A0ABU2FI50_9EURY|nr:hypothetical protein [Haloarcula sp. S1CR25-12]MDS0261949.1 hypothetical protein [Haloarcula sp. S1CR25-12]
MRANYRQRGQNRLTNAEIEQGSRFDELDMRGLYASPHLQSDCLGTRLENAGELLLAARSEPEYDEFGEPIEGTGQVELDAHWVNASLRTSVATDIDPIDLADEDLTGLPLEAQERLHGLRSERKRQREKALAAAVIGIDREARRRDELLDEQRNRREDYLDRVLGAGLTRYDPFERLDGGTAATVRETAAKLSDRLLTGPTLEALEHRLAGKVLGGQSLYTAMSNLQDECFQEAGVIQPIATVPVIPSKYNVEADIQGEVTTLWQPKSSSQQQVGIIKDDTGTIKFTIWTRSGQDVILHEGDLVRIVAGKVGKYNDQATLAADSETLITIIDRGDGPAPRGDIADVDWEAVKERNIKRGIEQPHQVHSAKTIPAMGAPGVEKVSRPVHTPPDRLDESEGNGVDAGEWLKATEIYEEGGAIPLPEWWRTQDNVVTVDVDDDASSQAVNAAIQEVVANTSAPDAEPASAGWESDDTAETDAEQVVVPDGGQTIHKAPIPPGKRRFWALIRDEALFGTALQSVSESAPASTAASELVGVAERQEDVETTAISEPDIILPSTSATCPECTHDRAHYRLVQLRSIDEPPTRMLTCCKCANRWREDN